MVAPQTQNPRSPHEEILKIIETIYKIGFPENENIEALKLHVRDLLSFSKRLSHIDQTELNQLEKIFKKIEDQLNNEGKIPVRLYTKFNRALILLENLVRDML